MARAYYNEIDPWAAAWLRELIVAGLIPDGDVDERSITEVEPNDLAGYSQCHFFAGIGGWAYALRLAGVPDDRPVWTGSCPCQPFSVAGEQRGAADERHLWPEFFRLIRECRPPVVLGEQVEAAVRFGWLDLVSDDLEAIGYAVGAASLPACSVGAPHIRPRLWFVAHSDSQRSDREHALLQRERQDDCAQTAWRGAFDDVADSDCAGLERREGDCECQDKFHAWKGGLAFIDDYSFWRNAAWIKCRDGRRRPTEPGIFPLVDGLPKGVVRGGDPGVPFDANASSEARVMRLRGYGNAIVPQLAAAFIRAALPYRGHHG